VKTKNRQKILIKIPNLWVKRNLIKNKKSRNQTIINGLANRNLLAVIYLYLILTVTRLAMVLNPPVRCATSTNGKYKRV